MRYAAHKSWLVFWSLFIAMTVCSRSFADEVAEQLDFFEKRIRPVLIEHCYECHATDSKKIRGGFVLDSREGIRRGGESGPSVVPGALDESLLLDAIRYESFEMPPSGKLSDRVIADFEQWIRLGATDPREANAPPPSEPSIDIAKGKQFWSFRPLRESAPPEVEDSDWPESNVDRYLLSKLESVGVSPVNDADRPTLLRRAYYALVGLPPTPEQQQRFLESSAPTPIAFAEVVDQLLESKHFGERWGRHWLDVVRFAESSGGGRTLLFPDAWRYRDYVIDSFNVDTPFDEFIREQIAGDLLESNDWQTRRRQLTATAFLLLGPTNYELQDKEILEMDIVDEQIDTIGKAFMGMTVGCARCHDHKFDPIPITDYYAMAGILKNTKSVIHSNVSTWNTVNLPLPLQRESEVARHEAKLSALDEKLTVARKQLKKYGDGDKSLDVALLAGVVVDDVEATKVGKWKESTSIPRFVGAGYIHDGGDRTDERSVTFEVPLPGPGEYEVFIAYTAGKNRSPRVPIEISHAEGNTAKYVDQTKTLDRDDSFASLGVYRFEEAATVSVVNKGAAKGVVIADAVQLVSKGESRLRDDKELGQIASARSKLQARVKTLEGKIKSLKESGPKRPTAMAATDEEKAADIHLAIRGVVHNKGPVVKRGVLQIALNQEFPELGEDASGRVELADWLVDRSNPLTARVIVNRVWYWLFGEGLVRTVDNFGAMGEQPSHPELLDHLAVEFINDGWSVKRLIRRLMLSHVYRLSSVDSDKAISVDVDNRLLWRMNRRRMDAESIRDTLLHVSGELDDHLGGANIKPDTKIEYDYVFDSTRRSVYLPVFRNTLPPIFATFDFADPNIQGGKRTTSTIAPQALLLMNHPFVIEQSRRAAKKMLDDQAIETAGRIDHCYRQVLAREPSEAERQLAVSFLGEANDEARWALLYQTLFQSLDFRYIQ